MTSNKINFVDKYLIAFVGNCQLQTLNCVTSLTLDEKMATANETAEFQQKFGLAKESLIKCRDPTNHFFFTFF